MPTGKDSLREEQERALRAAKKLQEQEARIISIERESPEPDSEQAVLDRRTGFFVRPSLKDDEEKRVIRRISERRTVSTHDMAFPRFLTKNQGLFILHFLKSSLMFCLRGFFLSIKVRDFAF